MERLLLWALLTFSVWKTGPAQILPSEPPVVPVRPQVALLGRDHSLDCDCGPLACEQVVWFRTLVPSGTVQFLGRSNQADRVTYGPGLDHKVRISKRSGSGYSLRLLSTSSDDHGVYSCVLKLRGKDSEDVWRSGVLLLPRESAPTDAPKRTLRGPTPSRCPEVLRPPAEGCGRLVLWPLLGLTSALTLTLLGTLLYYSRLPKKCRHQFVRKK